jgi:hypothetical protein
MGKNELIYIRYDIMQKNYSKSFINKCSSIQVKLLEIGETAESKLKLRLEGHICGWPGRGPSVSYGWRRQSRRGRW